MSYKWWLTLILPLALLGMALTIKFWFVTVPLILFGMVIYHKTQNIFKRRT